VPTSAKDIYDIEKIFQNKSFGSYTDAWFMSYDNLRQFELI
jgi:hypothetical protein